MASVIDLATIVFTASVGFVILGFGFWKKSLVIHSFAIIWAAAWALFIMNSAGSFAQNVALLNGFWVYQEILTYPMLLVYLIIMMIGLYGLLESAVGALGLNNKTMGQRLGSRKSRRGL